MLGKPIKGTHVTSFSGNGPFQ
ncbi:hypothetical protein CBM2633_B90125 [Cupriavidus taiwanensis]|nr:hypothetical protein CBM2614_B150082 [Cupriavidus taiwanensis]SPA01401.1 hypothetical protein CBM2626_B120016 [Cupriavidus taiwanensis]SPA22834.1 hypothetical protein CBM2633_B90125 [Cupriavidus taiwanensis]